MDFLLNDLDAQARYHLFSGGVTPRPIAWVSSLSASGVNNLAPYSFFTVASCTPPVLLFTTVMPRTGRLKDSITNIRATGECVVNIVSQDLLASMNSTAASFESDVSEFEAAGLASCPSQCVKPLSVLQSPVRYECTLRQIIELGGQPGAGLMTLLDVVNVYVEDGLYQDGRIQQDKINSMGKMGGDFYSATSGLVEVNRPA